MDTEAFPRGDRHAYMVICHRNFDQLIILLSLLDDPRNDIFVLIDKKSRGYSPEQIKNAVKKATITLLEPIKIAWGGDTLIKAEIVLLKEATKTYHAYYHLLSGSDLPIKTQDHIHSFLASKGGRDFVSLAKDNFQNTTGSIVKRVNYYYLLQNRVGKERSGRAFKIQERLLALQRKLHVRRTKRSGLSFHFGSQWFSITHNTALFILERYKKLRRVFRFVIAADEVFVQTILINSPYIENVEDDYLRLIDWKRGTPYIFREADFDELVTAGENVLFARKFDETVDKAIIDRVFEHISNEQNRSIK